MNKNTKNEGLERYFPESWAYQWIIFQLIFIGGYGLIIVGFDISKWSDELCHLVSFFVIEMFITAYGLKTLKEMKEES